MDYAKALSQRLAVPVSKCVSASASVTQQLLSSPAPRPRPYRICNWDRSQRKGIMAQSLADLLHQAQSALAIPGPISLVLDEDGTAVETESFFQTLGEGTVLMALSKGQTWTACKTPGYQLTLSHKPPKRIDVACVTFDLYKTNPQDLGCLNVKATLYGTYSMSYDLRCYGARRLMKEALRWTLFTMQATGHVLLGTSCYMQQLLDATEEPKKVETSPGLPSLLPRSLPPIPRIKMLQ
ncbi:lipid transferase CIDEC [Melanerpes formicivorus]|uniref:lipid transferase CIDEC n=1 Tax=Melanerpes formicivorus TaxID=211600 RepID=UPI00358F9E5C